jgi:integrase
MMREKLTATGIAKQTKSGRYADGGGLYLLVKPDGRKTWVFRWRDRVTGKLRDKGLGAYGKHDVTLAEARQVAGDCRRMVRNNKDPIEEARQTLLDAKLAYAKQLTFGDCISRYVDAHRAGWKNPKHTIEWPASLDRYASKLKDLPVAAIDTGLVVQCIEPLWATKTETMTRVRQRIEAVLAWATVRGYRSGNNPAQWRNHLDKLLPAPNKLRNVQHLAALPYTEVGAFMAKIRAKDSLAAKALELQILTASRPGEVVGATWDEYDLKAKVWTIPKDRMKADKEHEIPLTPQAIKLLGKLPRGCDFVFPGVSLKKGLSTAAAMKLIKELHPGITAHGFRSTFREWSGDQTSYPREVIEHALAHQLKDKAEAAYYRKSQFPKRVKLMKSWAAYCDQIPADADNVTPIRKGAKS